MSEIALSDREERANTLDATKQQNISPLFLFLLALASFTMWMGLIPLTQTIIPTHISNLFSDPALATEKYRNTSLLQALGGLSAMLVYPLVGALSDRIYTRFGRRKPWIVGGVLGAALMLVLLANAPGFWLLALCWIGFCFCANTTQSSLFTLLPDKVPVQQRAKVAAIFGLMAPLGIIAGTALAGILTKNLGKDAFRITYYVIAAVELIGVLLFATQLHEERPEHESTRFNFLHFIGSFWVDPRKYPDFARAWWGRVLFILGYATVQNYLLFYLQDNHFFKGAQANAGVATFQAISTVGLLIGSFGTGYLSDRLLRRKPFAVLAGVLVTAGLILVALVPPWPLVCVGAFCLGMGFGIYSATEVALGTQVLTSVKSHGKDMGVLALGGNIPQTVAPIYAQAVITNTHNYTLLFGLAALPPLLSSFLITRIKGVK